jgi:hydrogenase nickel incorporation protein HypA/HybF
MHEVSVCESILKTIEAELDKSDLKNVREIHLKIGVLSAIEPEILRHVFKYMIIDTEFEHAQLFAEQTMVTAQCENCGHIFKVEKYIFICTKCGEAVSNITEGKELLINKIILQEPVYEKVN